MISFYRQLAAALHQGSVVVATIVRTQGSVPREVGAKMFVDRTGKIVGTIGGGAGEAKVIQQAKRVLATGEKQLVAIDLSGATHRETQGICGGMMQVWLERWQGNTAIALVQHLLSQLETGQEITLVTPMQQARSPHLQTQAESPPPTPNPHSPTPNPQPPIPDPFTETLSPPPTLLVVGAGHCGIQLAKVADLIGFQVIVQDDRPEWATIDHYPQARILMGTIADAVDRLALHTHLYAALVTRGYAYDLEALTLLLQREIPCVYIGMIGSRKRVCQVFQAAEQKGITPETLQRVHAPIGLDIGALTPEEIAVSIGAELILVRRGGTGRPISQAVSSR
ncbi:MAG: XdhC/CoxI family protein [Leptolyngbyaceae cyanobacterium bins.302]|nr:XdhC/CoxI family protein [Leptolyngbyaceae cyanobacterium bins.302]